MTDSNYFNASPEAAPKTVHELMESAIAHGWVDTAEDFPRSWFDPDHGVTDHEIARDWLEELLS